MVGEMSASSFGVMSGGQPILLVARSVITTGGLARMNYLNTGAAQAIGNPSPAIGVNEWLHAALQGTGAGNAWEIKAEFVSGDPLTEGDAVDVWLAASSSRGWGQEESGVDRSTELDIFLRRVNQSAREYGPERLTLTSIAPT